MTVAVRTSRLLIVDDEPNLLEVLGVWFRSAGYDVRTATDGIRALQHLKAEPADVIITDLKMPGLNGLQLLSVFKDLDPASEVIFLTGEGTMPDAIQALREGRAFDFLLKPLKNLLQLHLVVEKAIARRTAALRSAPEPPIPLATFGQARMEALSPREKEIMGLLALGYSNRAIAGQLCLSEKTIKNNLSRIYEKLLVKSRTQAILVCREQRLL